MNIPKLILASGSPRRRELLQELGIEYTVQVSDVDEEDLIARSHVDRPEDIVTLLASAKAWNIATRTLDDAVILGADTIVWLDNHALNKPKDEDDAVRMLLSLSRRSHQVYTGIALTRAGDYAMHAALTDYEVTEVEFHPMTESEARRYVATGEPMDKAGAYGIQDSSIGKKLVKAVRGDYYNVVGLPLDKLREMLSRFSDAGSV